MDQHRSILLVRLKSLGDVLFTLPAVSAVRTAFPHCRLSFLVSKEYGALLQGFREVDEVISLDRSRVRGLHPRKLVSELLSLFRRLRNGRFSLAIDLQGYGETALLVRSSGAKERWGNVQNLTRRWAYTRVVAKTDRIHPIECNLALLRHAGLDVVAPRNEYVLPETALAAARSFFQAQRLHTEQPTLFIQPFTSSEPKNWPLGNYLAVARYWEQRGMQVLFGGGPGDRPALERVRESGFSISAGVPLLTSAGLANLATLVIGGDTGLLHLAVAMNKRVLMLMGSNSPGSTHPYQQPHWTVLPDRGAPLSSIPVENVNEGCVKALAEMGMTSTTAGR